MYTVAIPMEVPAIEIGEMIRSTPGAILQKVRFSSPGRKSKKGGLFVANKMKRILVISGTKVNFDSLIRQYSSGRSSFNWN